MSDLRISRNYLGFVLSIALRYNREIRYETNYKRLRTVKFLKTARGKLFLYMQGTFKVTNFQAVFPVQVGSQELPSLTV